jgi:hypothetical protein
LRKEIKLQTLYQRLLLKYGDEIARDVAKEMEQEGLSIRGICGSWNDVNDPVTFTRDKWGKLAIKR